MAIDTHDILTGIWRTLSRGVVDTKHDWHWPVLGTVSQDTTGPQSHCRIVVLRGFDVPSRRIEIHSDSRAQKMAQLQSGNASLLFYDARSRTQVRVQASASVAINNAISQAAWSKLPEHGRTQYMGLAAPGSQQKNATAVGSTAVGGTVEAGTAAHFAVIHLTIESIDWLILAREGHQRMSFVWNIATQQFTPDHLIP